MRGKIMVAPVVTTRANLFMALMYSALIILLLGSAVGFFWGIKVMYDLLLGAVIICVVSAWTALRITSDKSLMSPILMGMARYSLVGLGFAMLFMVRPNSMLLAVLAGSSLALALPIFLLVGVASPHRIALENELEI